MSSSPPAGTQGSNPAPHNPAWDSILPDAFALVHGDRGDTYGPPWTDYQRTVAIYNAVTGQQLTVADGITFMVAVKLSRIAHGIDRGFPADKVRDSITDACGYLDCLWGALNQSDREVNE